MKLWLNGKLLEPDSARITPNDRGFLLGDGLFETILADNGTAIGLKDHMDRLRAGATRLDLPFQQTDEQIAHVIEKLLLINDLQDQRACLRLTVSRGPGTRGLALPRVTEPTYMMTAIAHTAPPDDLVAIISEIRRNERSPLSALKTLNYLDNILARQEAASAGAGEAILLNTRDRVACASAANVFLVEHGRIVTPPVGDGALPGITRATVMRIAAREQIKCSEDPIDRERLLGADEVFLTNSLIGVRPVSGISGRAFAGHQLTQHLQSHYEAELDKSCGRSLTGR